MYKWTHANNVGRDLYLSPESIALTYNNEPDKNITKVEGQYYCCDDEVLNFKDPIGADIEKILQYEWSFVEETQGERENTKYRSLIYRHMNDILMAIDCTYADLPDDAQMLVLITGEYFVIVGVVGAHPFIETPWLNYCNSDGSCPDIFVLDDANPKYLAENLVKYYKRFINDRCH